MLFILRDSGFIMRESRYCFQRVLAIAILSVCPSVRHMGGSVKNSASWDHHLHHLLPGKL